MRLLWRWWAVQRPCQAYVCSSSSNAQPPVRDVKGPGYLATRQRRTVFVTLQDNLLA